MLNSDGRRRILAAVLAAVLAAFGGGVAITLAIDDDGATVTVKPVPNVTHIDGPDADLKRDDELKLNDEAKRIVRQAELAPETLDLAGNLRGPDSTRAGVWDGPLAAPEWPGCTTALVGSFSSRTSNVKAIALHYTAGGNLAGLADMNGLTAFSNNPRNEASWHFLIDREGHCYYSVATRYKAWTIAGLNSQTVNIEVVGRGNEPDYAGAGFGKLRDVVRRIGRLYGIPLRLGATDGRCNVTRTGILTHWMGGPCSGGHIDIKPYSIQAVVDKIAATPAQAITSSERAACKAVRAYRDRQLARRHGTRHDEPTASGTAAFHRRLELVRARGHRCVDGKAIARN